MGDLSMCDVFLNFITFPFGVLVQVWFLIVSIPDLCLLPHFGIRHYKEHFVKLFLCPQRNFKRHIVIALSVRPSVRQSVGPSHFVSGAYLLDSLR